MKAACLALAFVVLSSAFVACTEDPQTVTPQKSTRHPKGDDDDDDDDDTAINASSSSSSGGGVVDAATGGAAVTYRGTLDKTGATQFGGENEHCTYDVAMGAIEIEIAITPEGNVIGGTAKNDMTESIVGTCPYAPLGTKPMSFAFGSMNGQDLTWAQTNGSPKTNLTITLTKMGQSYQAAAKWVRADRDDDLKWTVTTTLTLGPK